MICLAQSDQPLPRFCGIGRRDREVKGTGKPLFQKLKSDGGDLEQQILPVGEVAIGSGRSDAKTGCKLTQGQPLNVRGG